MWESLRRLGVRCALDDSGTGFSTPAYLVRRRPKIIKIDRFFVSSSPDNDRNEARLETIVSLGNKLHATMWAEGIETQGQLDLLRHVGGVLGQGSLFAPVVASDQAAARGPPLQR